MLHNVVPMVEIRSEIEKAMGREEPGAKSARMVYFATESGMGHVRNR